MNKTKVGLPPGTYTKHDIQNSGDFKIKIINYDQKEYEEFATDKLEKSIKFINKKNNTWIHIECLDNIEVLEKIGSYFGIHSLILEDILNYNQRPKIEFYESYVFTVGKIFVYDNKNNDINETPVSMILGENYVISLQNTNFDFFKNIRDRIINNKGYIRKKKADYLLYALLDTVIDNFFILIENINDRFEELEDEILENPSKNSLHSLYFFKNRIINIQKSIWPLRELISNLRTASSKFIDNNNMIFLNDIYDHVFQIMDSIQTVREMITNMFDMYLSSISNKMNQVMKVLSIIGTIFIPLTFIAGIYGMNFKFMPELDFKFGYPIVIGVIIVIAVVMLIIFKKKKWF